MLYTIKLGDWHMRVLQRIGKESTRSVSDLIESALEEAVLRSANAEEKDAKDSNQIILVFPQRSALR